MDSTQLSNILIESNNIIANDNPQEFIQPSNESRNNNSISDNYNNNETRSNIFIIKQSTSTYVDEIEMPGENIVIKEPSHTIHLITIDLLIKKIIFENFITVYPKVFKAFCKQFYVFFKPEFVLSKLTTAFDYYYYNTQNLSLSKILNLIQFTNTITLELLIQYKSLLNTYNNDIIQTLLSFYSKITTEPILNIPSTKDIHYLLTQDIPYHYKLNILNKLEHPNKSNDTVIQSALTKVNETTYNKPKRLNAFYVLDWDDEDIVKQLTYISYIQLMTLQHKEFLGGTFIKSNKHETSPTIIKLCLHFDNLVMFVIQDILSYDNVSTRGTIIDKWINISHKCKLIHNYNDSFAIKQAISHYVIQKLKHSWKFVSKNAKRLYN